MTYDQLIESISLMLDNDKIIKDGLTLTYQLDKKNYKELLEFLFYKTHSFNETPIITDEFEVIVEGILIKFTKKTK